MLVNHSLLKLLFQFLTHVNSLIYSIVIFLFCLRFGWCDRGSILFTSCFLNFSLILHEQRYVFCICSLS